MYAIATAVIAKRPTDPKAGLALAGWARWVIVDQAAAEAVSMAGDVATLEMWISLP